MSRAAIDEALQAAAKAPELRQAVEALAAAPTAAAVRTLAKVDAPARTLAAVLAALLGHEVDEVRVAALRVRREVSKSVPKERVAALVRDPSPIVREELLRTASMIKGRDTPLMELLPLLRDDELPVRGLLWSVFRGVAFTDEVLQAVGELLDDAHPRRRENALHILAGAKDRAAPYLRRIGELLDDPDPDTFRAALSAAEALEWKHGGHAVYGARMPAAQARFQALRASS